MKVLLALILFTTFLFLPASVQAKTISPVPCPIADPEKSLVKSIEIPDTIMAKEQIKVNVFFNGGLLNPSKKYFLLLTDDKFGSNKWQKSDQSIKGGTSQTSALFTITVPDKAGQYALQLRNDTDYGIGENGDNSCGSSNLTTVLVGNNELTKATCSVEMPTEIESNKTYVINIEGSLPVSSDIDYTLGIYSADKVKQVPKGIITTDALESSGRGPNLANSLIISNISTVKIDQVPKSIRITPGSGDPGTIGKVLPPGDYIATVKVSNKKGWLGSGGKESYYCAVLPGIKIRNDLKTGNNKKSDPINPPGTPGSPQDGKFNMVNCASNDVNCVRGGGIVCANGGVQTAIGCIPTNPVDFVNGLMAFTAGAGGGIALLLMVAGSFQMITSQGSPDQLKKGREQFIAAATGLLFIIFSVTLLRIIGVDILQIPGFK